MCLFIESIMLRDGEFYHLEMHQKRMDASISAIYNIPNKISLLSALSELKIPKSGLYKCRIVYGKSLQHIQIISYKRKIIKKMRVVNGDDISYQFKYTDRRVLDDLVVENKDVDEIIILKNGLITDSSYSNLIFWDGDSWITPAKPLLKGIRREILLRLGLIQEAEIKLSDLRKFKKVGLINAMMSMENMPVVSLKNIDGIEG